MSAQHSSGLYIVLISIHGLIRGHNLELGRDADTGGQTLYVVELARALARHREVDRVDLLTRQVIDPKVEADYGEPLEPLADNAFIVRLPCGPRRYLRKETLWPYLDCFTDNALKHVRSVKRLPSLIHSHYADAGVVGSQLAGLLGIPLVHTGHSLGRVKQKRLLASGLDDEAIESRYNISRRIEAEEITLDTAGLVLTSTRQEVEEQYALYDSYRPERMVVNPPGIDVERFHPPRRGEELKPVQAQLAPFLREPQKPMILAISRPDERKNIATLVRAYGEDKALQELANLVIIAGTRQDIRGFDRGQRQVLVDLLLDIDRYNLYGRVAYPKGVTAEQVPIAYRLAAQSRGVFVNPAWTEPFGLTLIEAAASGLPLVATEDGGPRDIIGNCQNGRLIDPQDAQGIATAITEVLGDRQRWRKYADQGIRGVQRHYSWDSHAKSYIGAIKPLVGERRSAERRRPSHLRRPLPFVDRALICDIDNTLTGDPKALKELVKQLQSQRGNVSFGVATGRRLALTLEVLKEWSIPIPEVLITSVGTEIYYGPNLSQDTTWTRLIDHRWDPAMVDRVVTGLAGITPQPGPDQSRFKRSFFVDPKRAPNIDEIVAELRHNDLAANVIYSHERYLDILPVRANKGYALRYFADRWGIPFERLVVAGDSGNDRDMLLGNTLAIVVGNHEPALAELRNYKRIYFAKGNHAQGILEGLEFYDFFGRCEMPSAPLDEQPSSPRNDKNGAASRQSPPTPASAATPAANP